MDVEECVLSTIGKHTGLSRAELDRNARLLHDLHIDGDDALELLDEIAQNCRIDMSNFDASRYFRAEPSLLAIVNMITRRNRGFADKVPLTVEELVVAARVGKLTSIP
jgi:hypothetical protein